MTAHDADVLTQLLNLLARSTHVLTELKNAVDDLDPARTGNCWAQYAIRQFDLVDKLVGDGIAKINEGRTRGVPSLVIVEYVRGSLPMAIGTLEAMLAIPCLAVLEEPIAEVISYFHEVRGEPLSDLNLEAVQ
jgi:hypothetical protein